MVFKLETYESFVNKRKQWHKKFIFFPKMIGIEENLKLGTSYIKYAFLCTVYRKVKYETEDGLTWEYKEYKKEV